MGQLPAAGVRPRRGTTGGQAALAEGAEHVDTDVFFAPPEGVKLATRGKALVAGSGMYPDGPWGGMSSTQIALIAPLELTDTVTAVVYPRLKNEAKPVMTAIAGGKGVKVESPTGTDYVFLSPVRLRIRRGTCPLRGRWAWRRCGAVSIAGTSGVCGMTKVIYVDAGKKCR